MADDPGDNDVGYGKPPKHSQWKKGQSGNPSGKKKKELSIQEKLLKLAGEEIPVQKNGVTMSMSRMDAALMTSFGNAIKGDLPSLKFIAELLGIDPKDLLANGTARSIEIDEAAIAVLERHTDWVAICEEAKARAAGFSDDASGEESLDDGD